MNNPSAIAASVALAAGVCSGLIDTLVAFAGSWMHLILNRVLTPAAAASALQGRDGIDSSTLIQRWLLKEVLVDFYQTSVATVIGAVGTIVLVLAATFRTDSKAGYVAIICLGVWAVFCVVLIRKSIAASRQAAIQHEQMGRVLRSSVALRKDLSRPSAWRYWLRRIVPDTQALGRSILWQGIWASTLSGALGITAMSIPFIALIMAARGGGGLASSVAIFLFTSRLVGPLSEISHALTVFQDQLIAIQRSHDAFAGALDFQSSEPPIPARITTLEFGGSGVRYGGLGDSLQLPKISAHAGKLMCVVGPSGSGKSTLLSILAGQSVGFTEGLNVNGNPIDAFSLNWRESVGLLPQEPALIPGSITDNLSSFPGWLPTDQLIEATNAIIGTMLESETPDIAKHRSSNVSAGQRRSVAVLRVLGSNVPVVLLDEPIAGVDNDLLEYLRPAIAEAAANRIVIVALHEHDLTRLNLPASVITLTAKHE
jgi:ABC-type multidrug transport system fused ATPase/permease subunit